jgi:homoserine kinase
LCTHECTLAGVRVSVPASTANLGPGFDCLAMALDLQFHLDVGEARSDLSRPTEATHPAAVAFRKAGGDGPLFHASKIAPGKGLGYSGAAHVAGAAAASLQRTGWIDYPQLLIDASGLEGHADNAAASIYGGVTVAAAGQVVRLAPPDDLAVVVWIPDAETATKSSRRTLPETVPFDDAVHNVGRSSLLVAALATGRYDTLRAASSDRLHQQHRLAHVPQSAAAMDAAFEHGALAAWVSGSGPTIASLAHVGDAHRLADLLPESGHTKILPITRFGARVS